MKKYMLCIFLVLLAGFALGQEKNENEEEKNTPIEQIKRYEFEVVKKKGDDYSMYSLEDEGVLALLKSDEFVKGNKKNFIFTKLDTNFELVWEKEAAVINNFEVIDFYQASHFFYFLMQKNSFDYQILRLSLADGALTTIPYERMVNLKISHFKVLDDILFLGGEVDNKPVVVHYDYGKEEMKILPSIPREQIYLDRMDVDTVSKQLIVTLNGRYARQKNTFINLYDIHGKLTLRHTLENNVEYSLQTFRPFPLNAKEMLLVGTYALSKGSKTQGVYSLLIEEKTITPRFYDFVYLKNFFNYIPSERRKKYIAKAKSRKKTGRDKKFPYDFFVDELRLVGDKLYFSAESYIPVFNDQNAAGLPYWANMGSPFFYSYRRWYRFRTPFYNRVANPNQNLPTTYKFNNALVCAFDQKGSLQWDNSFSFDDHETTNPLPFMAYQPNADSLALLHFHDDKLYFKQVKESQAQEDELEMEFYTDNDKDKIPTREDEVLLAWYDNYFLMYGYQEIRNREEDKNKRKVYYLSKIQYPAPQKQDDQ